MISLRFSMLRAFCEESSKYVYTQFRGHGFGSDFQIKFWPLFVTKNSILSCFFTFFSKTVKKEAILARNVSQVWNVETWVWIVTYSSIACID